jgi:hypothetical protein
LPLRHNPYLGNMLVLNNWESPLAYYFPLPGSDAGFTTLDPQISFRNPSHTHVITCQLWWSILLGAMLNVLARNSHQHGTKKTSFHFENHFVEI